MTNTTNERVFMRMQLAEMCSWAGRNHVPTVKMNVAMLIWIRHNAEQFAKSHHPDAPQVKGLLMAPNVHSIW